jgi:hypothetical protein
MLLLVQNLHPIETLDTTLKITDDGGKDLTARVTIPPESQNTARFAQAGTALTTGETYFVSSADPSIEASAQIVC